MQMATCPNAIRPFATSREAVQYSPQVYDFQAPLLSFPWMAGSLARSVAQRLNCPVSVFGVLIVVPRFV
jgi:hypothetical protein